VILVDANLLLYSQFADFPQHVRARSWLESELNSPGRVGIPWQSSLAFLRLATNPRIFRTAVAVSVAWQRVTEWLEHPRVWIPEPGADHVVILGRLLERVHATGNLIPDAHLAALAIEHGLSVYSADSDFARFPGVTWINSLTRTGTAATS
jgi:toxin-antitoxin system PIN domain toxin